MVQEPDLYWHQWSPESGLLLPDKGGKFTEQISLPKDLIRDKDKKGSETKFIASSSLNGSNINVLEFEKILKQHQPFPDQSSPPTTTATSTEQIVTKKIKFRTKTTTEQSQFPTTTTEEVETENEKLSTIVHLVKVDNLPPFVDPGIKISPTEKDNTEPPHPLKKVKASEGKKSSPENETSIFFAT